jgi:hypothetical protein
MSSQEISSFNFQEEKGRKLKVSILQPEEFVICTFKK